MCTVNLASPVHHNRARLESALQNVNLQFAFSSYRHVFDSILSDDNRHLLAVSESSPEYVSYAQTELHRYDSGKRVNTSLQRYFRRVYKEAFADASDNLIENIASCLMTDILPIDFGFNIVSGDELETAYKVGPRSCMSGSSSGCVRLWAKNPEHIALLTLTEKEKLVGRCLIWGGEYYDNVYCSTFGGRDRFAKYLEHHSYKPARGARLKFTLVDSDNGLYPYADTLHYVKRMPSGRIVVRSYDGYSPDGLLNNTAGNYPDEDCMTCENCGDAMHEDDANYIEEEGAYVCDCCRDENYTWLEGRGQYVNDNSIVTGVGGEPMHEDDSLGCCVHCDNHISEDDNYTIARDSRNDEVMVCEHCESDVVLVQCPCCENMILAD